MSQNGKSKNVTSPDYMNLLYSDSESDVVPDLKLPPLKGKKQRRRKTTNSKQQEPTCAAWTIVKIIIFLCCVISIVVLTGLSYWALQRLNELEHQVLSLQSSDKVPTEAFLKLQNQIDQANKTFLDLRRGMDEFNKTLNSLISKIASIELKNADLEKSVSAAKEFVNTPTELHTLAETVAKLGSDQSQKSMELEAKLKLLEESNKKFSESTEGGLTNQVMKGQVDDLQKMMTSQIGNVTNVLSLQGSKISSLETLVQTLASQSAPINTSNDNVSKLNEQVTATLEDLKKTYLSGNMTERGEFLAFKQETFSNTEKINQTLYILSNEFDALSGRLDTIDSAVINITSAINLFRNDVNINGRTVNESITEHPSN